MKREINIKQCAYDLVVVGGGLSGICAAIAAARHGAKTAIVQARPMFGGNASSEIRMHVCGASANMAKPELEEGGILYELMLENKKINPDFNYSLWDMILYKKVREQPNLDYYLNTAVDDCQVLGNKITSITAYQQTTEIRYEFFAPLFVDASGNSTLGYLAGAEFRTGSEGRDEFNEPNAPLEADQHRMGNSLLFKASDKGRPVEFIKPDFAYTFSEEQLKYRTHGAVNQETAKDLSASYLHATSVGSATIDTGYWWIEYGGKSDNIIEEYEDIRDELMACVYGVWDHLKNGGDHGAAHYGLDWVGILPGMRESRRLVGDHILNEQEIRTHKQFEDAVAYGGWPMDIHTPNGIFDYDKLPTAIFDFDGTYTIPFRSYYSKNIENLMMAGRNISASKMAMGSTRVMGTCAIGGQAVGTAAALCIQKNCLPKDLLSDISTLQQLLLWDDCYIPGIEHQLCQKMAQTVTLQASSEQEGFEAAHLLSGFSRPIDQDSHLWVSNGIAPQGEQLLLRFNQPQEVRRIRLVFDTNFNYSIKQTQNAKRQRQQRIGVPSELVKDYTVRGTYNGETVFCHQVTDNYQRLNVLETEPAVCDSITVTVTATNGCPDVHLYEICIE